MQAQPGTGKGEIKGEKYSVLGYMEKYGIFLYDDSGTVRICPYVGIFFWLEAVGSKKRLVGLRIDKDTSSALNYDESKDRLGLLEEKAKSQFEKMERTDWRGKTIKVRGAHGTGNYITIDSFEVVGSESA